MGISIFFRWSISFKSEFRGKKSSTAKSKSAVQVGQVPQISKVQNDLLDRFLSVAPSDICPVFPLMVWIPERKCSLAKHIWCLVLKLLKELKALVLRHYTSGRLHSSVSESF